MNSGGTNSPDIYPSTPSTPDCFDHGYVGSNTPSVTGPDVANASSLAALWDEMRSQKVGMEADIVKVTLELKGQTKEMSSLTRGLEQIKRKQAELSRMTLVAREDLDDDKALVEEMVRHCEAVSQGMVYAKQVFDTANLIEEDLVERIQDTKLSVSDEDSAVESDSDLVTSELDALTLETKAVDEAITETEARGNSAQEALAKLETLNDALDNLQESHGHLKEYHANLEVEVAEDKARVARLERELNILKLWNEAQVSRLENILFEIEAKIISSHENPEKENIQRIDNEDDEDEIIEVC